ncbi:hypothetical protein ACSVIJ_17645 [Pseudomonas sp. NCHU5208]|uniref:hypothetical protein n=1 Tax=unclassified Pseudomonas TaxID=196821 RepID=UPI003F9868A3
MRKSLRTALIWMLMLALPAQAMAALGMQLCEQVHRTSALQMSAERHEAHGTRHDMGNGAHDMHQTASAVASDDSPGDSSLCTLCAFCVGVATPSQPFFNHPILQSVQPALAWPDRLVIGVVDTPERPPRSILA